MSSTPRTRIVALLALITMVFSFTGRAFAGECVHERNGTTQVASTDQSAHLGHGSAERAPAPSDERSECRHDGFSGCGVSVAGVIVGGYAWAAAAEPAVVTLAPASVVDLITTHTAFHPPRA